MTRDVLLSQAWGYDYLGESRTVDVHVAALREKLRTSAVEIQSVRGLGYKLVAPPAAPSNAAPADSRESTSLPASTPQVARDSRPAARTA
jgi:DNA-binding winged helix-turn-helix (wHTH) protein